MEAHAGLKVGPCHLTHLLVASLLHSMAHAAAGKRGLLL